MPLDQIRYLTHATMLVNMYGIFGSRAVVTKYDRYKSRARGRWQFRVQDQFPGVYMQWHLGGEDVRVASGDVVLVFPRDLVLMQKNSHLNLCDKNGFLSEGGTFFHDDPVPDLWETRKNKGTKMPKSETEINEVVFHDSVPMELCVKIYCRDVEKLRPLVPEWWKGKLVRLPKQTFPKAGVSMPRALRSAIDGVSEPCRVFLTDINYTGRDCAVRVRGRMQKKSSDAFVRRVAALSAYDDGGRFLRMSGHEIEAELNENDVYTKEFVASRKKRKARTSRVAKA